ncbi:hypothetical protein BBJ28_00019749, partial [Nothophytophthora sp. Chile5]
WDSCSSDDDDCLTTLYSSLKSSNGYDDIRTLLDSDTDLYGADCGYTNADATAKDPPSTGTATFSRGMVHVGPCEIWLDDTKVLSNDDCMTAYGDGTQATASVFTPVDYSSCSSSGCMLRFYWLAFQGVDSEIVWQVYKDCVPLTGPADGTTSTSTTTTDASTTTDDSTTSTTTDESSTTTETSTDDTTTAPSSESEDSTSAPSTESDDTTEGSTGDEAADSTEAPATEESTSSATTTESPSTTDSTDSQTTGSQPSGSTGNGWSGGFGGNMGGGGGGWGRTLRQ